MTYAGNTALSDQIQERIQNTFTQTVSLAEEGNTQEALLGCDFILRLDPLFEPARRLQERLNEGDGSVAKEDLTGDVEGEAPVEVAEVALPAAVEMPESAVEPPVTEVEPPQSAVEPPVAEVEPPQSAVEAPVAEVEPPQSAVETPVAEVEPPQSAVETPPTHGSVPETLVVPPPETEVAPTPAIDEVPSRMAMLFEQRNFQELISLANANRDRLVESPDLQQMVDSATEKLEAEPYVRNFLDSAQAAKEKDDFDGARSHLENARELDPTHPEIAMFEADLRAVSIVEPPAAFEPAPVVETPPLVEFEAPEPEDSEIDELFEATEPDATESAPQLPEEPAPEPVPVPSLEAEPAARLDSESEQRIDQLLNEGQQSFEEGLYQTAIDAWSRIFLIDIDHAEASRRIELARKLKAEVERQVEEAFHEGISLLESGDEEKARQAFDKVLEMQASHMGARDYLDKLDSGDLKAAVPRPEPAELPEEPPPTDADDFESVEDVDLISASDPSLVDDFVDLAPAGLETTAKPAPSKRSFALIGAAVLILVLAVGWFVFSNWNRFFPGSAPQKETTAATVERVDPIERARELYEAGSSAMAINVLRRLNPGHDQYAEGQALIAMWETGDAPVETVSEEPSEETLALRTELVAQAQRAMNRGENLLALDLLAEATGIADLNEEEQAFEARANLALELLREERTLFDSGDWEYALPNLWRIHESDPMNQDAIRLMVDCYYNLGLRDLQRGDARSALEKLEEAQDLTDRDDSLDRLAEFADAYSERSADMLYRIFIKYQRFR